MTSTNDIRRSFLDYFETNGHARVPSAPLVPQNDPTLMFVNAGMVPFKNVFTGLETRPYSRDQLAEMRPRRRQAQRSRQCRLHRAAPHLLRNARQFLVRRLFQGTGDHARLDPADEGMGPRPDRLTATVYHTDDEAFDLWKKIAGLPESRIIRIPTKDNFWAMGDNGPCGPCSEIFYDHGDHIPGGPPGSPGRGRRPLRRDLEPRLHAVSSRRRTRSSPTCRARASTPAWGSSASPRCCRASTTITTPTRSRR